LIYLTRGCNGLSNGTVQRLKDELVGRPFDGSVAA
jgi:hypothetical protein